MAQFTPGVASAYGLYGDYYGKKGEAETAIRFYRKALSVEHSITPSNVGQKLLFMKNIAYEMIALGDYAGAMLICLEGQDIALEFEQGEMLSNIYENIGILYALHGEFEQAIEFYKKALVVNEALGDELMSAQTALNLASTYIDQGNFENGLTTIDQSIPILKKYQIPDWIAFAYEVKGKLLMKSQNYSQALIWYKRSMEIHEDIEDPHVEVDVLFGISAVLFNLGEHDQAYMYATKGLELSKRIKALNAQKNILHVLYSIHKRKKETAKALMYFEKHTVLSDSLLREENNRSLALLKASMMHET